MRIFIRLSFLCLFLVSFSLDTLPQPGSKQNNLCEFAEPFCTGSLYNFPAGVNAGSGQSGPNYNCLITTPNPAWYYMKVDDPGNIIISMHSEPSKDIDFCCWGPYTSQNCCGQLTGNKVIDCSYSPAAQETCVIPNGQTGEYYMLVITNYSNQPCNIIFSQTGGSGTTDCTILPPPCSNNSPVCIGQTIQLTAQTVNNALYFWWGPDNFSSTQQNPTISNAQSENAGDYFLRIEVNGQPSADTSETTVFVYDLTVDAGNDTSINNGVFTTLHGVCEGGCGSYTYHWQPVDKLVDPTKQNPQTINLFSTTVFTLNVTDDSASCQSSDMVTVNIIGGALAVNAVATPSSICYGATSQLHAYGSGGAGSYTFEWSGPNGFTSTLPDPVVEPDETSVYTVTVFDGYNSSSGEVTVTVIPLPVAHAGEDKSIPHGTYTYLNGTVVGGMSNYFYAWSPANLLVVPNIQNPRTVNLTATSVYTLQVTDLVTQCISSNTANVTIEVTGGPLGVNPSATPGWICKGDSSQLHAAAGGGNVGFYEYSWVSNPAGFTSDKPAPFVSPTGDVAYTVTVFDGFNLVSGSTQLFIYPEPEIHLGPPDTTVCIFDTVTLDAGNPGSTYLWSDGATSRFIRVGTTGIGYDVQDYSVEVTNEHGCKKASSIQVIYTFDACIGIHEQVIDIPLHVFPNPSTGLFLVNAETLQNPVYFAIFDLFGKQVARYVFADPGIREPSAEFDLSDLPKGLYIIKVITRNSVGSHKLILR